MNFSNKMNFYKFLNTKVLGLICEEDDWLANLANVSAKLYEYLDDINWCGFYLFKNKELILGPFQGKSACTHIQIGAGVCGTAALNKKSILVDDVDKFEGHIACDSASKSEIVIPIIVDNNLIAVLDIDSPFISRFDSDDVLGIEKIVDTIIKNIAFPRKFI